MNVTITKSYPYVCKDIDGINKHAYNRLIGILANWESFTKKPADETKETIMDIINELMKPFTCPCNIIRESSCEELRAEFEPQFENGAPF